MCRDHEMTDMVKKRVHGKRKECLTEELVYSTEQIGITFLQTLKEDSKKICI